MQKTPNNTNKLLKKVLLGFDPAIFRLPRQRSTTCAISGVTVYHLNVIDE